MANAHIIVRVNMGSTQTPIQKYAEAELATYFHRMFNGSVEISSADGKYDVVIGTPESNPMIKDVIDSGVMALPKGDNREQGYAIKTIDNCIYIAGYNDIGALYGVYELLEQYGAYFQISGERIPAKTDFKVKQLNISKSPVFKYRGVLPWDNFLCGMSGYNLEDYQQLIDRLTRMKFNMLQFHFYPGMAFFTETIGNQTADPSCIGMPVDVFRTKGAIGEKAFKGLEIFGPKPYIDNMGNPRKQAEAVQEMMRDVINHAHKRGWKTCVGFELMYAPSFANPTYTDKPADGNGGSNTLNPLDEHNVAINVERYQSVKKIYPNSDFYWMWQNEGQGFLGRNVGREPGADEFRRKYAHWLGDPNLGGDLDYAWMFLQVANRLASEDRARLATGGWSIEHLFPGINSDFPNELIFASLNVYDPIMALQSQVDRYKVAESGRRTWMIDWWEFDGNQWFPQFRVSYQEQMYRKCKEFGVESVSLLGWKLSGIEHNVRYLSEFSWNPNLTAQSFYTDYCSKLYGPSAAVLGREVYMPYDEAEPHSPGASPGDPRYMLLGPGWMGLALPSVPSKSEGLEDQSWRQVVDLAGGDMCGIKGQERYYNMDRAAVSKIKAMIPYMDEQGRAWARLMVNRLEFRMLYLKSVMAVNMSLIEYDRVGKGQGIEEAKRAASHYANSALDLARRAIEKYSQHVRNRGDQGVIAQLNEQYYQAIRRYALSFSSESLIYATIDWTSFRISPIISFDFSKPSQWQYRDGKITMICTFIEGKPTLHIEIGGDGTRFNSVMICNDIVDADSVPFMDFRIRTTSKDPLAIMFQVENDPSWYSLNLIGAQTMYNNIDSLPDRINDGNWHRVTWNIGKLISDRIVH